MSFAEENPTVSTSLEGLVELIRTIASGGAKLEISVKLKDGGDHVPAFEERLPRPYETSGRLNGYRGIAEYLGRSIGFVIGKVKSGVIHTYKIGRKMYAYEDEVLESLSEASGSVAAGKILKANNRVKMRVY